MSTSEPSEEDGLSSLSGGDRKPTVVGLRDRLLREARQERQRYLEAGDASTVQPKELWDAGVQTDLVHAFDGGSTAPLPTVPAFNTAGPARWNSDKDDDKAQEEALRCIEAMREQLLMSCAAVPIQEEEPSSPGHLAQLEAELQLERAKRQELELLLARERSRTQAAQQQVLCLEYELDGKETALQVAEKALERKGAELQTALEQVRILQDQALASALPALVGALPSANSLQDSGLWALRSSDVDPRTGRRRSPSPLRRH